MKINVTQAIIDASGYGIKNCIVATAAKEASGDPEVICGNIFLTVNKVVYNLPRWVTQKIYEHCALWAVEPFEFELTERDIYDRGSNSEERN